MFKWFKRKVEGTVVDMFIEQRSFKSDPDKRALDTTYITVYWLKLFNNGKEKWHGVTKEQWNSVNKGQHYPPKKKEAQ